MAKSSILVIGGTGYVGRRIVKASLTEGHPTYVLRRPEIGLDIEKLQILLEFKMQGAVLIEGSFSDHRSLVEAVKQVDVVICTMSGGHFQNNNLLLQLKLVDAIKEAGNIKMIFAAFLAFRIRHGPCTNEARNGARKSHIRRQNESEECNSRSQHPTHLRLRQLLRRLLRRKPLSDGPVRSSQTQTSHLRHRKYQSGVHGRRRRRNLLHQVRRRPSHAEQDCVPAAAGKHSQPEGARRQMGEAVGEDVGEDHHF